MSLYSLAFGRTGLWWIALFALLSLPLGCGQDQGASDALQSTATLTQACSSFPYQQCLAPCKEDREGEYSLCKVMDKLDRPACRQEAREAFEFCRANCQNEHEEIKACQKQCKTDKKATVQACRQARDAHLEGCRGQAALAKEQCLGAWQGCREACSEALNLGLEGCEGLGKKERKECRRGAKDVARDCRKACQDPKDQCLEDMRAARKDCRELGAQNLQRCKTEAAGTLERCKGDCTHLFDLQPDPDRDLLGSVGLVGEPFGGHVGRERLAEPLQYELTDAPAGVSIDPATGDLSWVPGADQAGAHIISVRVSPADGGDPLEKSFEVTIYAGEPIGGQESVKEIGSGGGTLEVEEQQTEHGPISVKLQVPPGAVAGPTPFGVWHLPSTFPAVGAYQDYLDRLFGEALSDPQQLVRVLFTPANQAFAKPIKVSIILPSALLEGVDLSELTARHLSPDSAGLLAWSPVEARFFNGQPRLGFTTVAFELSHFAGADVNRKGEGSPGGISRTKFWDKVFSSTQLQQCLMEKLLGRIDEMTTINFVSDKDFEEICRTKGNANIKGCARWRGGSRKKKDIYMRQIAADDPEQWANVFRHEASHVLTDTRNESDPTSNAGALERLKNEYRAHYMEYLTLAEKKRTGAPLTDRERYRLEKQFKEDGSGVYSFIKKAYKGRIENIAGLMPFLPLSERKKLIKYVKDLLESCITCAAECTAKISPREIKINADQAGGSAALALTDVLPDKEQCHPLCFQWSVVGIDRAWIEPDPEDYTAALKYEAPADLSCPLLGQVKVKAKASQDAAPVIIGSSSQIAFWDQGDKDALELTATPEEFNASETVSLNAQEGCGGYSWKAHGTGVEISSTETAGPGNSLTVNDPSAPSQMITIDVEDCLCRMDNVEVQFNPCTCDGQLSLSLTMEPGENQQISIGGTEDARGCYAIEQIAGGGALAANELGAIYQTPGSGSCTQNPELELRCGGEAVDQASIVIEGDLEWVVLPEKIAPGSSAALDVSGSCPPYQWSISGSGFFLVEEETAGPTNSVVTDESAAGSATVTVIDASGQQISGTINGPTCEGTVDEASVTLMVNGQHAFQVLDANFPASQYQWSLSGGGSLGDPDPDGPITGASGTAVTYWAPAENPGCSNNATLILTCGGEQLASIPIGINSAPNNGAVAYMVMEKKNWNTWGTKCMVGSTYGPGNGHEIICYGLINRYSCDGTYLSRKNAGLTKTFCSVSGYPECYSEPFSADQWRENLQGFCDTCYQSIADNNPDYTWDVPVDVRTQEMKDAGCCPAGL